MNRWIEYLKNDNYMSIKKYIKDGANLDDANESGESVLACALRARCDIDTLMLLIDSGADIFEFDDEGVSVLDMAITYDNFEIVEYILGKGVDINRTNRRSRFTPLMCASSYGRTKIVKLLLDYGADKEMVDDKGFSATDFARKMNKKSVLEILEFDKDAPQNKTYAR